MTTDMVTDSASVGEAVVSELTGRGMQPRQLIVTIYGLYAREAAGWLSVASLVQLLADLGVDEPAVRSSISRLKRRGILLAERRGGAAGYELPVLRWRSCGKATSGSSDRSAPPSPRVGCWRCSRSRNPNGRSGTCCAPS